jgi:formimidoylglutamate deiminase
MSDTRLPPSAQVWLADQAVVDGQVRERVRIEVGPDGRIAAVAPDAGAGQRLPGLVVPGIANLHSHAFQRAMAGLAERAGPEGDSFWQWREIMFRFLAAIGPEDVEAIAAQLYAECLLHGYTAVGEFAYLHHAPDGRPYANPAELSLRLLEGAAQAGIRMTLLPVLYRWNGFGRVAPGPGQRRFVLDPDAFARLCTDLQPHSALGVAPHSLRAVAPDDLAAAVAVADGLGPGTPIHIHVAEQVREAEDCLAWCGQRPVAWLLDHAPVDARWCLVHATQITPAECGALAASGAVTGLCPTTEANLGDGVFPLLDYLGAGGRFGVGSDSNVSTSPVEELRWLEYVARLHRRARNVTETEAGRSVGAGLLRRAGSGGAQALGLAAPAIAPGMDADLVVLDTGHPSLVGRSGDSILDSWLFSGNATPVRDVMVKGRWAVRDFRHVRGAEIARNFTRTMRRLQAAL